MLYNWLRLLKKVGTVSDISLDNQDDSVILQSNFSTNDYLYIGQLYPFNNFYYWLKVANSNSAKMKIEYWSNNGWIEAIDLLDGTNAFAKSGLVQFSPNKDSVWTYIEDTLNHTGFDLNTKSIYNQYWIRISFDTNLSALTTFNKIGYAFTSTQQLNKLDVEINSFYASFENGKSDWIKEILTASELLILDLKTRNVLVSREQILKIEDVSILTDLKALELIYSNLGKAYDDKRERIIKDYEFLIKSFNNFTVDKNQTGLASKDQMPISNNAWLSR
jgi:hypothetical protein